MSYDLRGEYQRQLLLDQYNTIYNTASTQDPRLKELMDMLSRLVFSQPVASLSPGWQTGFEYLSRAVVNSPLAPTLGVQNHGDAFADYHAAILQQGGLPMMNTAGNIGLSYGAGATTLGLAQHMQRHTAEMAARSGVDPQLAAGFLAGHIQQNGFRAGDIMSYGDSSTRYSADLLKLYQESKSITTPETQKAILQQTMANKALEFFVAEDMAGRDAKYKGKSYEQIVADPESAAIARKVAARFTKINDVRKEDLLRRAKQHYDGISEMQGLSIHDISSGHLEQAIATNAHGMTYTTASAQYARTGQDALNRHADNLKELSKIFDTKNFAELDNITKTLQMGSFQNERTVQRMKERIDGAKRTALVTNRDVKEVLAEQSSIMDVLGLGAGGKHLVSSAEIQRAQVGLETFRKNKNLGLDTRSETEFLTDLATGAADDRQNLLGTRMAELALSDKYVKGLTADQQKSLKELRSEYLAPGTSRERQKVISAQLQEMLVDRGGIYASTAFQNEAAKLTSEELLAAENRGLMRRNSDTLLTNLNSQLNLNDSQLTNGSAALAGYLEVFGNDHSAGKELQAMRNKGTTKESILEHYRQKGAADTTLSKIGNWLDFQDSLSSQQRDYLSVNMGYLTQESGAMDSMLQNDITRKVEAEEWRLNKSGAFEDVEFSGGNFLAGLLGDTGEITDEAILLNHIANGSTLTSANSFHFKDGKYSGRGTDFNAETRSILGLDKDTDLTQLAEKDWTEAFMRAEKNGYVVAQDSKGAMHMTKKNKQFEMERERYAKITKGLNPLYSVIKDISGLTVTSEAGKRVFRKGGKEVSETDFLSAVRAQLDSDPESKAKYEAALEQSGDPDAKIWDKKMKLADYVEDLTLSSEEHKPGKQFTKRLVDESGKLDVSSAYYKMYKQIFDKGYELYGGKKGSIMRNNDVGKILQHMLQNNPDEAIKLLENGAFAESNLIAGKSKDQLKAEGLLGDDNKFTGKAGNLAGVQLTDTMLQFSQNTLKTRSPEEAGSSNENLLSEVLNCFKQLLGCVKGDALHVDLFA